MREREEEREKTEQKLKKTLHELGLKLEKLEKQIQETKFVSELLAQARQDIVEKDMTIEVKFFFSPLLFIVTNSHRCQMIKVVNICDNRIFSKIHTGNCYKSRARNFWEICYFLLGWQSYDQPACFE